MPRTTKTTTAATKPKVKPVAPKATPATKQPVARKSTAKAGATKAPVKKAPSKKAPIEKASAMKTPTKKTPVEKTPVKETERKKKMTVAGPPPATRPAKATTAAAATTAKAKRPAKGVSSPFTVSQRALLLEERETYTRQASNLRAEAEQLAEDREPGDVQFDEESGQGDSMNVERERDLALSEQAMQSVHDIDRALAKIDAGTYGTCEKCGTAIPEERLMALPQAALCVQCKSGGLSRR